MTTFDSIVIGAGQAGPTLAVELAKSGSRTLLIERESVGGTCVNTGCTPTKTLVASARVAHVARNAAQFGVTTGPVTVDISAVKARMNAVRHESRDSLTQWLQGTDGLVLMHGHARFTSDTTVRVADQEFTATQIFVNTGARVSVPPIPGLTSIDYLTNSTILELETIPDHLVVIGGSYIGIEFAQVYRRFGARVSIVEVGPHLIGREDAPVSQAVTDILVREGIQVHVNAKDLSVEPSGHGFRLSIKGGDHPVTVDGSHCLVAVGRRPNSDDLGLENTGIKLDARGFIQAGPDLRTAVPHVFAMGDVNGRGAFTHTSYNDFQIVLDQLRGGHRSVDDRYPIYALFMDPPLARVGLSLEQVRATKKPSLVATMPMSRVGRARERGETDGFMQVVVDAESELILGATLFGIEADEAIHAIVDTMYAKVSYRSLMNAVHIHPTVSELLPTLLEGLKPVTESP